LGSDAGSISTVRQQAQFAGKLRSERLAYADEPIQLPDKKGKSFCASLPINRVLCNYIGLDVVGKTKYTSILSRCPSKSIDSVGGFAAFLQLYFG